MSERLKIEPMSDDDLEQAVNQRIAASSVGFGDKGRAVLHILRRREQLPCPVPGRGDR